MNEIVRPRRAKKTVGNIISYADARAARPIPPPNTDMLTFDELLAKCGLDRAELDAAYAELVTDEDEQAPGVAFFRSALDFAKTHRANAQRLLDHALAEYNECLKHERKMENSILVEKGNTIRRLLKAETGDDEPQKPKGRRKRK